MKHTFFVFFLFLLISLAYGQSEQNYSAMILSLSGEGTFFRDSKQIPIELPQRYFPGDVLTVQNGSAIIMLFSGQEVSLDAVSYYTVPFDESNESNELYKMANSDDEEQSLLSQSGVAYRIRGKSNVFPTKSKVLNAENVSLRIAYDSIEELSLNLKVIDSRTQKVLFEQDSISENVISLAEVPFVTGKSYYWTLSNNSIGKPEMGTIVIPSSDETNNIVEVENIQNHFENLNAISALYKGMYFFDAYALLKKCTKKYPNYKIYQIMLENILAE